MKTLKAWLALPFRILALLESIDKRLATLEEVVSTSGGNGYAAFRTTTELYKR